MFQRPARGFGVACVRGDKPEIQLSGAGDECSDFISRPARRMVRFDRQALIST